MSEFFGIIEKTRGFSPFDLPGLFLWLDANSITGLADGDPVATWPDKSGNGRDATQATASLRPIYRTNVLNGMPVVRFDGVDDALEPPQSLLTFTNPTLIAVTMNTGDGNQPCVFNTLGPTGTTAGIYRLNKITSGGVPYMVFWVRDGTGHSNNWNTQFTVPLNEYAILAVQLAAGGVQKAWKNGGTPATATITDYDTTYTWNPGNNCFVGRNNGGNFHNGDIAELLIYDNALSNDQMSRLFSYLSVRYNITVT